MDSSIPTKAMKSPAALSVEELNQLYYLNIETAKLQESLEGLESEIITLSERSGSKLSHTPKHRGRRAPIYKLEDLLDSTTGLKKRIKRNLRKIQRERLRLEKYISTIEDVEIRLIFRLRHMEGMSWDEIGQQMHMHRTTVFRKHRAYIG